MRRTASFCILNLQHENTDQVIPRWISRNIGPCLINSCELVSKTVGTAITETRLCSDLLSQCLLHYPPADPKGNLTVFDHPNDGLPFKLLMGHTRLLQNKTPKFQKFVEQITSKVRQINDYPCSNRFITPYALWISSDHVTRTLWGPITVFMRMK